MKITKAIIKKQFIKSEKSFLFCWDILNDVKNKVFTKENFGLNILTFQDKLAEEIFELSGIREKIIAQEKDYIKNKKKYNPKWFESKLRLLAHYKRGVDSVTNIAKSLGDAYAYFFYQFDLELLEEHGHHTRIINSAAGIGEMGELEFIKQTKYLYGYLTLYHGITNILRNGDYSFINLSTRRVAGIGELKSKKTGENTITVDLVFIGFKDEDIFKLKIQEKEQEQEEKKDNRKAIKLKKQVMAISKLLNDSKSQDSEKVDIVSEFYFEEINALYKSARFNSLESKQVSDGLVFSGIKYKSSGFFNKLYLRNPAFLVNAKSEEISSLVTKVIKPKSNFNSIIYDQVLYTPEFIDKNIPGTVPIFWQPLDQILLKKLYFFEYILITLFNPIHIIEEIEDLGFKVESKYSDKNKIHKIEPKSTIQQFDRFIPYITNSLQKEAFVVQSIQSVRKLALEKNTNMKVLIKPQHLVKIF